MKTIPDMRARGACRSVPPLLAGALVLLALCPTTPRAVGAPPDPAYRLAWADEFNGTKLDAAAWDYRTDRKHWSAQRPENVSVHDGCLWLTLKKEDAGGMHYTGGGVISKRRFKYGYYEARFKVPPTKGWHTSFWLMASDGSGGTNPRDSVEELDICENDSVKLRGYSATTHRWLPSHRVVTSKWIKTPDLAAHFHVWGCEFTPEKITYYFDGKPVETSATAELGQPSAQNIWLTAIASWLGPTDAVDASRLPVHACYDYVRFYQRDDVAGGAPRASRPGPFAAR